MKKQSIANRKSLDKIKNEDPKKYDELNRLKKIRSATSSLRLYATKEELKRISGDIKEVNEFLENHSNLSKEELKKLRFERFKKKRGRPKRK